MMKNSPSNIFYILLFREISLNLSHGFGCYRHEWVKKLYLIYKLKKIETNRI